MKHKQKFLVEVEVDENQEHVLKGELNAGNHERSCKLIESALRAATPPTIKATFKATLQEYTYGE